MKEERKDALLAILEAHRGEAVSGEEIAKALGVSRAAVCKEIARLRAQGYRIEAKTRSGYLLSAGDAPFGARSVAKYLSGRRPVAVEVVDSVDSTNNALKKAAEAGEKEGKVLIALRQTAGKGRRSHSFYSPESGLYLSILLRPKISAADSLLITTAAACAVAGAIERVSGKAASIKWVNDVYLGSRKVCGILTEASVDFESGSLAWAVLGIGINLKTPAGGFPEEIRDKAGAVFDAPEYSEEKKSRLAAAVIDGFFELYERLPQRGFMEDYRNRSNLIGKRVKIIRLDEVVGEGTVAGIDDDARLLIRTPDGALEPLSSGEVSVFTS